MFPQNVYKLSLCFQPSIFLFAWLKAKSVMYVLTCAYITLGFTLCFLLGDQFILVLCVFLCFYFHIIYGLIMKQSMFECWVDASYPCSYPPLSPGEIFEYWALVHHDTFESLVTHLISFVCKNEKTELEMSDRMEQFTHIMQQKFLSGADYGHLDYLKIDEDETLDDHWTKIATQDAEDKYFDDV